MKLDFGLCSEGNPSPPFPSMYFHDTVVSLQLSLARYISRHLVVDSNEVLPLTPPYGWVATTLVAIVTAFPTGITRSLVLSELQQRWHNDLMDDTLRMNLLKNDSPIDCSYDENTAGLYLSIDALFNSVRSTVMDFTIPPGAIIEARVQTIKHQGGAHSTPISVILTNITPSIHQHQLEWYLHSKLHPLVSQSGAASLHQGLIRIAQAVTSKPATLSTACNNRNKSLITLLPTDLAVVLIPCPSREKVVSDSLHASPRSASPASSFSHFLELFWGGGATLNTMDNMINVVGRVVSVSFGSALPPATDAVEADFGAGGGAWRVARSSTVKERQCRIILSIDPLSIPCASPSSHHACLILRRQQCCMAGCWRRGDRLAIQRGRRVLDPRSNNLHLIYDTETIIYVIPGERCVEGSQRTISGSDASPIGPLLTTSTPVSPFSTTQSQSQTLYVRDYLGVRDCSLSSQPLHLTDLAHDMECVTILVVIVSVTFMNPSLMMMTVMDASHCSVSCTRIVTCKGPNVVRSAAAARQGHVVLLQGLSTSRSSNNQISNNQISNNVPLLVDGEMCDDNKCQLWIISSLPGLPTSIPLFHLSSIPDITAILSCVSLHTPEDQMGSNSNVINESSSVSYSIRRRRLSLVAWLCRAVITDVTIGRIPNLHCQNNTQSNNYLINTPLHWWFFTIDDGRGSMTVMCDPVVTLAVNALSIEEFLGLSTVKKTYVALSMIGTTYVFSMTRRCVNSDDMPLQVDGIAMVNADVITHTFFDLLA